MQWKKGGIQVEYEFVDGVLSFQSTATDVPLIVLLEGVDLSSTASLQQAALNAPSMTLEPCRSSEELASQGAGFFFDSTAHTLAIRPRDSNLGTLLKVSGLSLM